MRWPTRWIGPCALLSLAVVGCRATPTAPPASLLDRFDAAWNTFDAEYSYFEYKRVNWDSLRTVHRPRAAAAATQDELVAVLRDMTAPLRDVHVRFVKPDGVALSTYQTAALPNWERSVWDRYAMPCGLKQQRPNLGYCTMGGIAYVMVGSWDDRQLANADLDAVVDRFREAPAMIIDVRPNGGGSDALAYALAGRFATASTVVGYTRTRSGPRHDDFGPEMTRRVAPRGSFQFTKPVVVLSGRGVFSSCESFISAMRELPNVTVLGDTTGGATANPRSHALGDGWSYTVSTWIEWTADRRVIEWQGIPPDVYVPWSASAAALGRDVVLESALARLSMAAATRQ
jgi:hypothetical protein